jgi:hypothetical protein
VWVVAGVELIAAIALRRWEATRAVEAPTIDLAPDGLSLLHLSASDV